MTNHLQAVTRVRGEFLPTDEVKTAINRFLDVPANPDAMKLYTSAQAIVDTHEFRREPYLYKDHIDKAEEALARTVLLLSGAARLRGFDNGGGFLFLPVSNQPLLDDISHKIHRIEGFSDNNLPNALVFEITRGGLALDKRRRREQYDYARDQLRLDVHDSKTKFDMKVVGNHIVTRDLGVRTTSPPR